MSFQQTILLGALAGFTIYLGLPAGRIRGLSAKTRSLLSMSSAGILLFLLFDIMEKLTEPINEGLGNALSGKVSFAGFGVLFGILAIGLGIGLLGLVGFTSSLGRSGESATSLLSPRQLSLVIAAGIGFHNFSEGLAIGQSASAGQVALATLLILGFGLHNATEGFGIVGPLAQETPSWRFLGLLGLIGGGPTFFGTLVGYYFVSTVLFVLFLALAAGALIYVIGELFRMNWIRGTLSQAAWGVLIGLLLTYLAELLLTSAGA